MIEFGNIDVVCDFGDVCVVVVVYIGLLFDNCNDVIVNVCFGIVMWLKDVIVIVMELIGYYIEICVNFVFVCVGDVLVLGGDVIWLCVILFDWLFIVLCDIFVWML